ncbi:hypothetical protein [Scopulibacillus daqui]|uniref:hypothetical protein n=1 Tax=Scopulibacillus daqui TaxID=1469162 RepID=UPI00196104B8|nr:hypothetical protein [Scopulibacillus daqui]
MNKKVALGKNRYINNVFNNVSLVNSFDIIFSNSPFLIIKINGKNTLFKSHAKRLSLCLNIIYNIIEFNIEDVPSGQGEIPDRR